MTIKSKSILISLIASVVFVTAYVLWVTRPGESPATLQEWAVTMLVFLGISIVALIIVKIVFHIVLAIETAVTEGDHDSERIDRILKSAMAEDEMDRMIDLRSARVGYVIAGFGVVGVLLTLAFGGSAVIALHVLLGSLAIGSFVSGIVSIYGYERGLRNA